MDTPPPSDHDSDAVGHGWKAFYGCSIIVGLVGLIALIGQFASGARVSGASVPPGSDWSIAGISTIMSRDAGRLADSIHKVLDKPESQKQLMALPSVDVPGRLIHFEIIERSKPIVLYEAALQEVVQNSTTELCHFYRQTELGDHNVTVRQTSYNKRGAPIFSIDVDTAVCADVTGG